MSIATEQYLDDPVDIPEPNASVYEQGSTIDSLEEDRQLRLQGLEEGDELSILVSAAAEAMVRLAASQVGVAESGGDNNGVPLTRYVRYFVPGSGPQPWCTYFVSWCWDQATDRNRRVPWTNPGYVPSVLEWAQRVGRLVSRPQRGDLVGYRNGLHIGIVESVSGNSFTSIEGNWSNRVSRVGRTVGSSYFFVRL